MKSLTNTKVGEYCNLEMTMQMSNGLPRDGQVRVKLPKWNTGTQKLDKVKTMIQYSSSNDKFSVQEMGFYIDCSAPGHPNIKCVFQANDPQSVAQIATTFDVLIVLGLSQAIPSSGTYVLTITNSRFRNPPSTKPLASITATSYTSTVQPIDTQSMISTYQATIAAAIDSSKVSVKPLDISINHQTTYDLSLTFPMPLTVGAVIEVKIPSQVKITTQQGQLIMTSAEGQLPLYKVLQVSMVDQAKQLVRISNVVPNSQYYVEEGTLCPLTLFSLQNPASSGLTDSFEIKVYDQDYLVMAVESGVTIQSSPGVLTSIKAVPDNYRVRALTAYTFIFTVTNAVPVNGQLLINLPQEMSVSQQKLAFSGLQNIGSTGTVTYESSTRRVTVKNAISTHITAGAIVKFQISGLLNPYTTKESSSFTLATADFQGFVIDQSLSSVKLSIVATANEIPQITVTPCSEPKKAQTISQTSQMCTYQLKVGMNTGLSSQGILPILTGSYIEVEIPKEIVVVDSTAITSSSSLEGIVDSSQIPLFTYSSSKRLLKITKAFESANVKNEFSLDSFSIYIGSLLTPRSTEPTPSYKVRIYDSTLSIQYKHESQATSAVSEAKPFNKVSIIRSSEVNGETNVTYDFTLNISLPVNRGEFIKVIFPQGVRVISTREQCRGVVSLASVLGCSLSNSSLFITLMPEDSGLTSFPAGTVMRFTVSSIINPSSIEPTESFQIYITSSRLYNYYVNQLTIGLLVQNRYPGLLSNVSVYPDSNKLNTITSYTFYLTTSNSLQAGSFIEVVFPSQFYQVFTNTTLQCSALKNLDTSIECRINTKNRYAVQITKGISSQRAGGQQIGFRLQGIKNPSKASSSKTSNASESIILSTYTAGNYLIDQTANVDFTIGCQYPCATCSKDQTSCTSCLFYESSSSLTLPMYLYGNTCGKQCPSGYFDNAQNTCQRCNYPCQSCFLKEAQCSSCLATSSAPFLLAEENRCLSTCPSGTYASQKTNQCEKCSANCRECSQAPNLCSTCNAQAPYIWDRICFKECPNTTVPLNSTVTSSLKECQACKKPCQTCSNVRDNCTSCVLSPIPHYLYQNECLETCPKMYLPNDLNVCEKSDEPVYPFLSFIVSFFVLIIVVVSNRIYPNTRLFTVYLALQSVVMIFLWIYLLLFLIKDRHFSSTVLVAFALFCNFLINSFWHAYYCKKVVGLDKGYQRYQREHGCMQRLVVFVGFLTTFQLFRIQYSRLFNLDCMSCTLELKDKYYLKLNRYSLMQITFVYLPVIAANIYNLFWTWYGRQVFWIDIECIATSVAILIAHVVVILRTEKLFVQEKYELPNVNNNQFDIYGANNDEKNGPPSMAIPGIGIGLQGDRVIALSEKHLQWLKKLDNNNSGSSIDVFNNTEEQEDSDGKQTMMKRYKKNQQHRVINDKEYVTIGAFQAAGNIFEKNRNFYNQLPQETTRTLGDLSENHQNATTIMDSTNLINDLDYTSVPLNIDNVLKENEPVRRKFQKFQQELEEIAKNKKMTPSKQRSQNNESPVSKKQAQPTRTKKQFGSQRKRSTSPAKKLASLKRQSASRSKSRERKAAIKKPGHAKVAHHVAWTSVEEENSVNQQEQEILAQTLTNNTVGGSAIGQLANDLTGKITQQVIQAQMGSNTELGNYSNGEEGYLDDMMIEQELLDNGSGLLLQHSIDPKLAEAIKNDLLSQQRLTDERALLMNEMSREATDLQNQLEAESIKKEELQIVIDDLHQQVAALLEAFNQAAKRREEELQIIDKGNFTSDEEDMGITPSAFNLVNQISLHRVNGMNNPTLSNEEISPDDDEEDYTSPDHADESEEQSPVRGRSKSPKRSASKKKFQKDMKNDTQKQSPKKAKPKPAKSSPKAKKPALTEQNGLQDENANDVKQQEDQPASPKIIRSKSKSPAKANTKSKKKKKGKKGKKGRSKSRRGRSKSKRRRSKSKRSKSKKSRKSKSKKSKSKSKSKAKAKKNTKIAPLPVNQDENQGDNTNDENNNYEDIVEQIMSLKPETNEMEEPVPILNNNSLDDDVDRLSVSMTNEEFVNLLEEDRGIFILDDITEQILDGLEEGTLSSIQQKEQFINYSKQMLKNIAVQQSSEGQQKRKLREHIQDLSQKGKLFFADLEQQRKAHTEQDYGDEETKERQDHQIEALQKYEEGIILPTQDDMLPKTKVKRRRKQPETNPLAQKAYNAYFNYLPFEKAVIESKGKTPYSNREVEQIVLNSKQRPIARIATPGQASASGRSNNGMIDNAGIRSQNSQQISNNLQNS